MDRPWSTAEKFDEAARMAKAGCSVEQIIFVTRLMPETVKCLKQKHCPDYNSPEAFASLRRNQKANVE